MNSVNNALALFVTGIIIVVGVALILSYFVMLLWNWCLVPAMTGVNEIGWLQAWGITVLFGVLFKNSSYSASKK